VPCAFEVIVTNTWLFFRKTCPVELTLYETLPVNSYALEE